MPEETTEYQVNRKCYQCGIILKDKRQYIIDWIREDIQVLCHKCKKARERYHRYLQSDTWKKIREAALEAAGFQCRRCSEPATEVHHETYERLYNEWLSDLTPLCRKCHMDVHLIDYDPEPTVYITRTGIKYHTYDCQFLKDKGIIRKEPVLLNEVKKDYDPCGICILLIAESY